MRAPSPLYHKPLHLPLSLRRNDLDKIKTVGQKGGCVQLKRCGACLGRKRLNQPPVAVQQRHFHHLTFPRRQVGKHKTSGRVGVNAERYFSSVFLQSPIGCSAFPVHYIAIKVGFWLRRAGARHTRLHTAEGAEVRFVKYFGRHPHDDVDVSGISLRRQGVLENVRLAAADAVCYGFETNGIKWRKVWVAHEVLPSAGRGVNGVVRRGNGRDAIGQLESSVNQFVVAIIRHADAICAVFIRVERDVEQFIFDAADCLGIARGGRGWRLHDGYFETASCRVAASVGGEKTNLRHTNRECVAAGWAERLRQRHHAAGAGGGDGGVGKYDECIAAALRCIYCDVTWANQRQRRGVRRQRRGARHGRVHGDGGCAGRVVVVVDGERNHAVHDLERPESVRGVVRNHHQVGQQIPAPRASAARGGDGECESVVVGVGGAVVVARDGRDRDGNGRETTLRHGGEARVKIKRLAVGDSERRGEAERVGIAVHGVVGTLVLERLPEPAGVGEAQDVGAGRYVVERKIAVGIRKTGVHLVAIEVEQQHDGRVAARFAGILNAVGVEVVPHEAGDGGCAGGG